ncbi:carboxypeptidase M32 [Vogesella alkaliphila]|uniref:Metal-dependent carboxypeptidase n=1 Tax=Vogesella alkaliphila TaxID=1193621 RepID=A0ABQ2YPI1_9NEIS|nr:carboxypeptidase M32 [Vogesella alkaliphila]GGX90131.1 carboxypeptidase Taq [Vogesella alkaliphila]
MTHPAYQAAVAAFTRLYRYQHLAAIAGWDQAAMMPPGGNAARGAAMAELQLLMHGLLTAPALQQALQAAAQESLSDAEQASLREMRRSWQHANLLPARLVEAKALAGSRCEHAWREQRKAGDWQGFLGNFREVVQLAREEAQLLADASGKSRYDALLDKYEPGMSSAELERIFGDVKSWLPGLIRQVMDKQAGETLLAAQGPFAVDKQRALGVEIMGLLGFDFDAGRLDVSVHPFCGGVAEDVRITTRYRDDDFMQSMMGIVHETGHARYEQRLPRDLVHLPVGQARSMGIHESQSLSFEMQLGRSPAFLSLIAPLVKKHLGEQSAFDAANLARMYSRVRPGFIRVDADELTYPAHVILRYEIERALIEGEIEAEDIPALWDEKMQAYLGVDTRGNYRDGCMQDIHWTDGSFGYFPSYTLGAMYAAQYFATLRCNVPDLDARIAAGDLAPVFDWLDANIWSQASRWETGELVRRATGEALNPAHFRAHLQARYL